MSDKGLTCLNCGRGQNGPCGKWIECTDFKNSLNRLQWTPITEQVMMNGEKTLAEWTKEIHETAHEHGWHEEPRTFGEFIALCHAELSEALEEYRDGLNSNQIHLDATDGFIVVHEIFVLSKCPIELDFYGKKQKPEGIPIELADVIIRILDFCGESGIDIEKAMTMKHLYNQTRPWRHGGKKI